IGGWRYGREGSCTRSVVDGHVIHGCYHGWTGRRWSGGVYHARSAHSLVVIALRDYTLHEEQLCQPPIGVAGRRRLADLRHFLRGQNALCFQDANERIDRRIAVRLLRPAPITQD